MDNKKQLKKVEDAREVLQAECNCGQMGYVVVPDLHEDVKFDCLKCGQEMRHVVCKKCQSGYIANTNDKKFWNDTVLWKCTVCKEGNMWNNNVERVRFFTDSEQLPEDLRKTISARDISWKVRFTIIGLVAVGLGKIFIFQLFSAFKYGLR